MGKKGTSIFLLIYKVLLSLSIVAAGICLAAQCLLIYRTGDHPFTPETVAAAFSQIAIAVYLCGVLVLAGVLMKPFFPAPGKKKPEKNHELILSRLEATIDLNECPKELEKSVVQLLVRRTVLQSLGWSVLALCSVIFLVLGANPANFHSTEINASMIRAMCWLVPCMVLPFAYGIFAAYYRKRSIRKEIDLLRSAPAEAKVKPEPDEPKGKMNPAALRWAILCGALVLLVGGYLAGGAMDVLTKAVNICTECIGLG